MYALKTEYRTFYNLIEVNLFIHLLEFQLANRFIKYFSKNLVVLFIVTTEQHSVTTFGRGNK